MWDDLRDGDMANWPLSGLRQGTLFTHRVELGCTVTGDQSKGGAKVFTEHLQSAGALCV